jgi:hypothetical protein
MGPGMRLTGRFALQTTQSKAIHPEIRGRVREAARNVKSVKQSQFIQAFELLYWLAGQYVRSQILPFYQLALFC